MCKNGYFGKSCENSLNKRDSETKDNKENKDMDSKDNKDCKENKESKDSKDSNERKQLNERKESNYKVNPESFIEINVSDQSSLKSKVKKESESNNLTKERIKVNHKMKKIKNEHDNLLNQFDKQHKNDQSNSIKKKKPIKVLGYTEDKYFDYKDDKIFLKFLGVSMIISIIVIIFVLYDAYKKRV